VWRDANGEVVRLSLDRQTVGQSSRDESPS